MAERGTVTFSDPDGYAAGFADARVNLTITGVGDFKARLTRLNLNGLNFYRCRENLPRIAYVSLPSERIFLSFLVGTTSFANDGFALQNGDIVLHGRGDRLHQRSSGKCQWGLISLSPEQLASYSKALTGRPIAPPQASRILRPSRAEVSEFQQVFRQACRLAEARRNLIENPEVARALEQAMLHAITHCIAASDADDNPKTRHRHAAVMVRFEEALSKRIDQKVSVPGLCSEIGVAERTLRTCCVEFLCVNPTRYLLLRRLNKARSALRRADHSTTSVAEIARNHQFLEFGRFAVTYRATFGESPSTTLLRASQAVKTA
jgi:AraC-like DNA-binding protein